VLALLKCALLVQRELVTERRRYRVARSAVNYSTTSIDADAD
jgi:hypothetical protein